MLALRNNWNSSDIEQGNLQIDDDIKQNTTNSLETITPISKIQGRNGKSKSSKTEMHLLVPENQENIRQSTIYIFSKSVNQSMNNKLRVSNICSQINKSVTTS